MLLTFKKDAIIRFSKLCLLALCGSFGLQFLIGYSPVTVTAAFFLIFAGFRRFPSPEKRSRYCSYGFSAVLGLFFAFGKYYSVYLKDRISLFKVACIFLSVFVISVLLWRVLPKLLCRLLDVLRGLSIKLSVEPTFLRVFLLIFLLWLPVGIMTGPFPGSSDAQDQINQILTGIYHDHHPIIYTLFLFPFVKLFQVIGPVDIGIFLSALLQSAVLAAIISACVIKLKKFGVPQISLWVTAAYFAVFPLFSHTSYQLFKNSLFGGFCALLCMELLEMKFFSEYKLTFGRIFYLGALFFLFATWIHNGLYVLILVIPFFIITLKKLRLRALCAVAVFAVLFSSYSLLLLPALNYTKGDLREALCIPIMQVSFTVKNHKNELTEDEKTIIAEVLPYEQLPELYSQNIADGIKSQFKTEVFKSNPKRYMNVYGGLLKKYPVDFVNSVFLSNYKYLYPIMNNSMYALGYDTWTNKNIHFQESYSGDWFPILFKCLNKLIYWIACTPILNLLTVVGFYSIIWLLLAFIALRFRLKPLFLPLLLLLFLFFSIIAGPVNGEFRYFFPFYTTIPFLSLATLRIIRQQRRKKSTGS